MVKISVRGRPQGAGRDKREAIAAAAAELFGSLGYDNTSIRLIAEKARVDPKLISHYFGTKPSLFAAVLKMPPQADNAMQVLKTRPVDEWGVALVEALLDKDGKLGVPQMIGVIKSASAEPEVAASIREFYLNQSLEPLLANIDIDHSKVRSAAMSSLLVGFTFGDSVLNIPVGNTNQAAKRRKLLAVLIQRILTEPLD